MTFMLFTVSVTALDSGVLDLSVLDTLAQVLGTAGILDAAVTMDSESISFTGQVNAMGALEAVELALAPMLEVGHNQISALSVEPCVEEEYESNSLKVAVA